MLNKDKKLRFIDEQFPGVSLDTKEVYFKILTLVCEIEKYYKKDLEFLSVDQLNGLLEHLSTNYLSYKRYLRMIVHYLEWCGVDTRPDMIYSGSDDFQLRYYDTFDNFYQDVCESLDVYKKTVDAFYGLILLLAWIGLTKDEIFTLDRNAIDYQTNKISTQLREYENVNRHIINLCKFCDSIDYFENKSTPLAINSFMFRKMDIPNSNSDAPIDIYTMHHAIDRFNEYTQQKVTFNTIRKSGLFEHLRRLEERGDLKDSSPTAVWRVYIDEYFKRKTSGIFYIKQDYFSWKEAFGL